MEASSSCLPHPLDPLTVDEINQGTAFVKQTILPNRRLEAQKQRFITISLHEPEKDFVRSYNGEPLDRQAKYVIVDPEKRLTYECVISITNREEISWVELQDTQPLVHIDEFMEMERVVKRHPDFIKAMNKRGLTDPAMWCVEPWSAGYVAAEDEEGKRLVRAQVWTRMGDPIDNCYAHPVGGIVAVVDLNAMKVDKIEDWGVVPVPPTSWNYYAKFLTDFRPPVKPISITQPEGVNWKRTGNLLEWQKWSFRVGWSVREGLVLHTIRFMDRPVIYRANLAEMVVPYGDPSYVHSRKNAFDMGEYGLGILANSLRLGCDCLGVIEYIDGVVHNTKGEASVIKNAICIHEEDNGLLWKHSEWRLAERGIDSRRSIRLVVSFIATVGNYEYGFFWHFYQDGTLECRVKMTGLVNTSAVPPDQDSVYGTLLDKGLEAQIHQHHFCFRLDMEVDGPRNSVYEVNTRAEDDDKNPYKNAFRAVERQYVSEREAHNLINPLSDRFWKITNPSKKNKTGKPVAWKLVPVQNAVMYAKKDSWVMKRAAFLSNHLWATRYDPNERYPGGEYPNQSNGTDGIPVWTRKDRSLDNQDLVLWYNVGANHVVRLEDMPVMPVDHISFKLKPTGFCDQNPTIDIPPARKCCL